MIIYINGNIGSGKTALAVAFLYSFFPNKFFDALNYWAKKFFPKIDGVKKDKLKIYTNISGFKFEDFDGKAEFLNFDILSACSYVHYLIHVDNKQHQHIDKAINSFFDQVAKGVEFDNLDTDLDLSRVSSRYEAIKGFQFNHIILLIDEVADYFVEGEPHLDKWFNYSRHLYQDMILLQNDLSSIDKSYKNSNVVSYFIKAAQSEDRLHPQLFKYAFFRKWTQPSTDKPSLKMFWMPTWIFDKYDSGQSEKSIPKIYFYLVPFLFLLVFFFTQVYTLFFSSDDAIQDSNISVTHIKHVDNNITTVSTSTNTYTTVIHHKNKSIICFKCRSDTCFYNNDIYTFNRLESFIDYYGFEFIYKDKFPNFSKYCFAVDNSFLDLYKSSSNDVKDSKHGGFKSMMIDANHFSPTAEK